MKKEERKALRNKTVEELKKMASEKRREVVGLKLELVVGKHKNLRVVKNARGDLARIYTILREKMLEGGK